MKMPTMKCLDTFTKHVYNEAEEVDLGKENQEAAP